MSNICLVYGRADDDRLATYTMRLERGGKLSLYLSAGLYQRLGLEGEALKKRKKGPLAAEAGDDYSYKVTIDLCGMQPGEARRARLLQQAAIVWGQEAKLPWTFVCSQLAWTRLRPLLASWEQDVIISHAELVSNSITVPAPPSPAVSTDEFGLPPTEEIEDVCLWMGAITCGGLLMSGRKLDPFISTCSWPPSDAEERTYQHHAITVPGGIAPLSKICELIEALAGPRGGRFYVSGNDGIGHRGFLMQIDPASGDFFFCST